MAIKTDDISPLDPTNDLPEERLVGGDANINDNALERALRPKQLDEYVGQKKARGQLEIFISAAKQRQEALTMFYFLALQDWVKQPLRTLLPKKWVLT